MPNQYLKIDKQLVIGNLSLFIGLVLWLITLSKQAPGPIPLHALAGFFLGIALSVNIGRLISINRKRNRANAS